MQVQRTANISDIAEQITRELSFLVGEPLADCLRAADMHIFRFGQERQIRNRKNELARVAPFGLHVQCRWRLVRGATILFGRDDLSVPADSRISFDEFDHDLHESILEVRRREWMKSTSTPIVESALGDAVGGFKIKLSSSLAIECFPCHAHGQNLELWRFLGHRADRSHFVVRTDGIE